MCQLAPPGGATWHCQLLDLARSYSPVKYELNPPSESGDIGDDVTDFGTPGGNIRTKIGRLEAFCILKGNNCVQYEENPSRNEEGVGFCEILPLAPPSGKS